jgi:hypothetical protein
MTKRRKNQQCNRVQNEDSSQRYGHFFFVGVENRGYRGDGAASAIRRSRGDEVRRIAANFENLESENERETDSQGGIQKSAAARQQNFMQIHSESQCHDGSLK